MNFDRFITMVNSLNMIKNENLDISHNLMSNSSNSIDKFLKEFGLLDFRVFQEPVHFTIATIEIS